MPATTRKLAYFECLHELKLIVDLMYEKGISGMRYSISNTAEYGDMTRGKRVIGEPTREAMKQILAEIQSGEFAREWIAENRAGQENFKRMREEQADHQVEREGKKLRSMMDWIDTRVRRGLRPLARYPCRRRRWRRINPFIKQYLMTAGPDARAAARLAGDGRAGALPPRPGRSWSCTRACCERLPAVFRTENDVLLFAASGSGAMESAVANLVRPGDEGARLRRRQVRRALDRARARPTAPTWSATSRAGARASTRPRSTACSTRTPASRSCFATLSETSTGIVHDVAGDRRGRARARRAARRRRRLRPRRRRSATGRVGHRRRRRRLAEGADDPARPRASRPSPSARSTPPRQRRAAATTSTGRRPPSSSARTRRTAPSRPPVTLLAALDVALEHDRGGGARERAARATRCSPAPPAPAPPRSASTCTATPTSARTSSPRSRCPRTIDGEQGARRSCATATASPPTAARPSSAARSCASPTAATSAPSTSSRRCRGWRWRCAARPPGRAGRRRRRRAAGVPRGRRPGRRCRVTDRPRPRQGADRRLRRRRSCASASTSTSGVDWSDGELAERIGAYDGILIRSATKIDRAS